MIIATPEERSNVEVNKTMSLRDILRQNNINYSRASVMMDGLTLDESQLDAPLEDLGGNEDSTVAITVKLQNA